MLSILNLGIEQIIVEFSRQSIIYTIIVDLCQNVKLAD